MNFLQFVNERKQRIEDAKMLNEAFKNSELGKARDLMLQYISKKTKRNYVSIPAMDLKIDGANCTSELFYCSDKKHRTVFSFDWRTGEKSTEVYSITFYDSLAPFFAGNGKAKLQVKTGGASIVYFLPLIVHVLDTADYKLTQKEVKKYASSVMGEGVKESMLYVGLSSYKLYENVSDSVMLDTYRANVYEALGKGYDDGVRAKYSEVQKKAAASWQKRNNSEIDMQVAKADHELFEKIRKIVKDNREITIEELEAAIKNDVVVTVQVDDETLNLQKKLDAQTELKDPEQVFKQMRQYIKMVGKGVTPAAIICGAPGVGKTFKTMQTLTGILGKEEYDPENEKKGNLFVIKGKATAPFLYKTLFAYRQKGDIILIDDADSLVGKNAPEDCINILKAALDSTSNPKGRLVSYATNRKDGETSDITGETIPKSFYYNGGVVVLTNYRAEKLNSAFINRSYVQSIQFTPEQTLKIIKGIIPGMDPEHLSAEAKKKALDFLLEMANDNVAMALSIRTFKLCANMFQANLGDPDFDDDDTKDMIRQQIAIQSAAAQAAEGNKNSF